MIQAADAIVAERGACKGPGVNRSLFYGTTKQMRRATLVCARCSALDVCLWATMLREVEEDRVGTWGGCIPSQRRLIARVVGNSAQAFYAARLDAAIEEVLS